MPITPGTLGGSNRFKPSLVFGKGDFPRIPAQTRGVKGFAEPGAIPDPAFLLPPETKENNPFRVAPLSLPGELGSKKRNQKQLQEIPEGVQVLIDQFSTQFRAEMSDEEMVQAMLDRESGDDLQSLSERFEASIAGVAVEDLSDDDLTFFLSDQLARSIIPFFFNFEEI